MVQLVPPPQAPLEKGGLSHASIATCLVERVGPCPPVCEEQRETNGLEHSGKSAYGDGVEGTPLSKNLRDELCPC